jgi:uncharacterized repeat protein (TIGR02543 family)
LRALLVASLCLSLALPLAISGEAVQAAEKSNKVAVTFDAGKGKLANPKLTKTVNRGKVYGKLPTPTRLGYKFAGWYTKKIGGARITEKRIVSTVAAKKQFYAQWSKYYTINFNPNGGKTGVKSKQVTYGAKYGNLPVPTRYGYYFTGWYTTRTGGTLLSKNTLYGAKKNRTVYARWEKQTRVACVGASITYGTGFENRAEHSYPAVLQRMLGPRFLVGNFGKHGATVCSFTSLSYTDTERFQKSIDFKPDIVVTLVGTNDALKKNWGGTEFFSVEYNDLISFYQELPSRPDVFTCVIPEVYDKKTSRWNEKALTQIREIIQTYGWDRRLPVIDMRHYVATPAYYQEDGVHPNEHGAYQIAFGVYERLNQFYGLT